jgi:hypothetical protein
VCFRCLLRIDDAVFWSRWNLSLSLSRSLAENLRPHPNRVPLCSFRNNHCAGRGMCFFKKWLLTRNLSLRYIVLSRVHSCRLTLYVEAIQCGKEGRKEQYLTTCQILSVFHSCTVNIQVSRAGLSRLLPALGPLFTFILPANAINPLTINHFVFIFTEKLLTVIN